ncbi:7424_t:CDS:2 [Entrophospora sp. SA101]|nr:7424_t:CDS:2 [Entrophospora sp. SA101]
MILDFDDPILSYWGSSTASKYRKDQLSKLEKEYRNKENVNPFSISNVGNKPDLWVETKIAGRLHEIIFSETSGSPFNDTSSDEKIKYDRKKLIRFARDTFTKMCNELIENKISYLPNYKEIYKAISNIQIFLLQSCGKRMKIYIVDFPSNSFGRVREYCDLEVPYKSISEIELQRFIGTLFRIRVHMESNIKLIRKISTELSKNFNGIPGRANQPHARSFDNTRGLALSVLNGPKGYVSCSLRYPEKHKSWSNYSLALMHICDSKVGINHRKGQIDDDQSKFNRKRQTDYLQMIIENDKKMISQTIEILVGLEKKKLNKSDFDKKLCEQFMQNVVKLKEEPSGWIIKIGKNEYDFVKIICNSLININAMILDFDDPILSY